MAATFSVIFLCNHILLLDSINYMVNLLLHQPYIVFNFNWHTSLSTHVLIQCLIFMYC
jgi:hypothetical protein